MYSQDDSLPQITRKIFISVGFFVLSPLLVFTALSFTFSHRQKKSEDFILQKRPVIFASLPNTFPEMSFTVESEDARPAILRKYLKAYNSPLLPYAKKIVEEADKNGLDFRLLVAIARQESNLCKYAPDKTFNCWGWGIHKSGTLGFESFEEGIEVVSLGLKENYLDKGYVTPDDIMKKYTPHSNGSWAYAVNQFMDDLK